MTPAVRKGLVVAGLHVLIVASLGAKLLIDRATLPRGWARAAPVDPDLPIRGRYVRLRVEAKLAGEAPMGVEPGIVESRSAPPLRVVLSVRDGELVATPAASPEDNGVAARWVDRGGVRAVVADTPLAFFIAEHAPDPSVRAAGEELWVEVTVPRSGPPRPIRLAVKKDGSLEVLE